VGVQRQWIGRFGKVDNCQMGVFVALGCHERVLPINFRLYLPKEGVTDRKRCRQADVPKEQRVFKRKHDLALEMVTEARRHGQEPSAQHWHMIIRRELGSPDTVKYSLSNAPEETSAERLAFMQGQRYWVERTFQDAKGPCGMADYQVHVWRGWHHHLALVMIARLFLPNPISPAERAPTPAIFMFRGCHAFWR
jgi:SRSO17 transposase